MNTGFGATSGGNATMNTRVMADATDSVSSSPKSSFSQMSNNSNLDVDTALAKELHRLSVQDRNRVQEEVHGVQFSVPEETPQMIEAALLKFQHEVRKISGKHAYNHAITSNRIDPTYILSPEFQLRFLRAALYNAKKPPFDIRGI
ncbi:hypothetical protein IV203_030693 [Nitzschia inconspicua]|uniref:Uncharacterized protein n=1 Tax=Nitzschia inconspicua TaxID=303405 RepID=A0A9K3LU54_9STRA|nr:hypothetical protein IV203_030693 [Nitzschia inconspicua]